MANRQKFGVQSNFCGVKKVADRRPHPAPCFFHVPQRPTPAPVLRPMPRRASKRQQSPRGQLLRACQPIGGGLRRRGQNLWPRLAPGSDNCPRFARGGPPCYKTYTTPSSKQQKPGLLGGIIAASSLRVFFVLCFHVWGKLYQIGRTAI